MTPRFLPGARLDIMQAVAYYESEAAGLGDEFIETVSGVIETLLTSPRRGSPFEGATRRLVLPRFPFSLVYRIERDELLIVAVAHQRREPGFWQDR